MPAAARRRPTVPPLHAAPRSKRNDLPYDAAQRILEGLAESAAQDAEDHPDDPPLERLIFDALLENGGHLSLDRPLRAYEWIGNEGHLPVSRYLQDNLWRYNLTVLERGILDRMAVHHDVKGQFAAKQAELAEHFGYSQPRISKSVSTLCGHHFIWVVKRSLYQVHPLYAYRWGSSRQRLLIQEIGLKKLEQHKINVPAYGGKNR